MRRTAAAVLLASAVATAGHAARFEAAVTRTTHGIAHVTAPDWRGAGFGVGYAYAADNLCMIAEEFATLAGERSLHFGPKGETVLGFGKVDNLSSDLFFRSAIDLKRLRRGEKAQGPEAIQLVQGWVTGYNRRLREIGAALPEACRGKRWVRPITRDDALRLNEKQMLLASSLALAPAIVAAQPPRAAMLGRQDAALPEPDRRGMGSNGWAFGGEVTADGRGLLVGNPHFPWNGPSRFWQMHVTIPGKLDAMGVGIAGSPLPTLGFNRDVAWTHTVTAAQHFTLFQLKLDPADPTRYLVDGKSEAMGRRLVRVPVPDGPAVARTLYTTRFGPVVAMPAQGLTWSATTAFAFRDVNQGNQRALGTWVAIARARSVGEIRQAVEAKLAIPWVNTIAADRHGDILHADVTAVPDVSAEKARTCATPLSAIVGARAVLLDGSRAACDWQGLLPATEQAVYARRDWLANSNDSYWLSQPAAPYRRLSPILGEWGTARSLRTRSGLVEIGKALGAGKLDRERAKTMTFANKSLAADLALAPTLGLCAGRPELADACRALRLWDGRFDADSRGALLFLEYWNATAGKRHYSVPFDPADPVNTPRGFVTTGATGDALAKALASAAAKLKGQGIALDARWGDVHFVTRGGERIAVHGGPGALGVLNVQNSEPQAGGLVPVHGSSYVQLVGFDAEGPVADAVLSYSQSTDPASPWFADQTRLYSVKGWHRLPFTPAEIEAKRVGETLRIAE